MPNFVSGEIQAAALNTTAGAPATTTFPMNGRISRATAKKERDEETVSYLDYRGSEYPRLTGNWYHYNTLFNGQFGNYNSSSGGWFGQDTWGPSDVFYFKGRYYVIFRPGSQGNTIAYMPIEMLTTTTDFVNGNQASTFTIPGSENYNFSTLLPNNTSGVIGKQFLPVTYYSETYLFGTNISSGQPALRDLYFKPRYSPERIWAVSTFGTAQRILTSTSGNMGSYTSHSNPENIAWSGNGFQKYLNGYCITTISDFKPTAYYADYTGKLHSTDAGIPAPTAANQGVGLVLYNQNSVPNPWCNGNIGYAYSSDYGVTWKKVIYPTKGISATDTTGRIILGMDTYFTEIVYNDSDKRYYMMESLIGSNDSNVQNFVSFSTTTGTRNCCRIHYSSSLDGPWSNYQISNLAGIVTGFSYVGNGRLVISLWRGDSPTAWPLNAVYNGKQMGFQTSKRKAGFATAVGAGTLSASGWGSYDIKTFSSLYTNPDEPWVHTMMVAPAWNGVTSVICGYQLEMAHSHFQSPADATRITRTSGTSKWRPFIFTTTDWATFTEQLPDDGNVGDNLTSVNNPRAFAKVNYAGGKFFMYNLDYIAWYFSYNSSREWGDTWRQNTLTWSG